MKTRQLGVLVLTSLCGVAICAAADGPMTDPAPATQPAAQSTGMAATQPSTQPQAKFNLLGAEFTSEAYSISFRPPPDCTEIHTPDPDTIVEFDQEKLDWQIKVARVRLQKSLPLSMHNDQFGHPEDGVLQVTLRNMRQNTPDAQIVHGDDGPEIIHEAGAQVGLVFVRFMNVQQQRKLLQEAIIEVPNTNNQLYYFVTFTCTARPKEMPDDQVDAGEKQAYDTFTQMLDSLKLLDRGKIADDQKMRLMNTRVLFVNWSSNHNQPIKAMLVPEQWVRIVKDGKDIGYTYTVEKLGMEPDPNNVLISVGVRSRVIPAPGLQWDSESWMHVTADRKVERWQSYANCTNAKGEIIGSIAQVASSVERTKAVRLVPEDSHKPGFDTDKGPMGQGRDIDARIVRTLSMSTTQNKTEMDPISQDLPVFYVPQAISNILPRLLPLDKPREYMVGTFVSSSQEDLGRAKGGGHVMLRYLDVQAIQEVKFNGRTFEAVPVTDHIGLTGPVTTHYLSQDGKFLGSSCTYSDEKGNPITLLLVPTDSDTLQRIWTHPDLTAPREKDVPTPKSDPTVDVPAQ